jgi:hypothetical protein
MIISYPSHYKKKYDREKKDQGNDNHRKYQILELSSMEKFTKCPPQEIEGDSIPAWF